MLYVARKGVQAEGSAMTDTAAEPIVTSPAKGDTARPGIRRHDFSTLPP